MGDCEICGAGDDSYLVQVEGAKLHVCEDCSKSGKLISVARSAQPESRVAKREKRPEIELRVVDDFSERIRKAREKMKISKEVLSELVNEKSSFIDRIEAEKAVPNESLARRLERALGITLLEEVVNERQSGAASGKRGLTLGDIVFVKKSERKSY